MNKASLCLENDAGLLFAYIRLYKTNREIREIRERNFQRISIRTLALLTLLLFKKSYSSFVPSRDSRDSCSISVLSGLPLLL